MRKEFALNLGLAELAVVANMGRILSEKGLNLAADMEMGFGAVVIGIVFALVNIAYSLHNRIKVKQ